MNHCPFDVNHNLIKITAIIHLLVLPCVFLTADFDSKKPFHSFLFYVNLFASRTNPSRVDVILFGYKAWKDVKESIQERVQKTDTMAEKKSNATNFSEDIFGRKIDRCLTDTIVKGGEFLLFCIIT